MFDIEFLSNRAFAKTLYDYLFHYLFRFTDLRFRVIVLIRSVSLNFSDLDNFSFVFLVHFIDDSLNLNIIEVTLFPDLNDCFFRVLELGEDYSHEI